MVTGRTLSSFVIAFAAAGVLGCSGDDAGSGELTDAEREIVETLSPLPPPPDDPTNKYADDPDAALIGQKWFFDTRYAGALQVGDDGTNGGLGEVGETGKAGCVSCHDPDNAFSDKRSNPNNVSLGVNFTDRNAPSMLNIAHYREFGWGGKQGSLWTQASLSPESGSNSAGNRCNYAHVVWEFYRDEYNATFDEQLPEGLGTGEFPETCKPKKSDADPDGAWEGMTEEQQAAINQIMANVGKATAAYERLLQSGDSAFDRYVAGDESAISASAKNGLKLFIGKGACVDCHEGTTFTDHLFHNTGVPQMGPNVPEEDTGRFDDLPRSKRHEFNPGSVWSDAPEVGQAMLDALEVTEADIGAFRTKALRNVADTAPYMHNGVFETLEEVVAFYSDGGADTGFVGTKSDKMRPLNLSAQEQADLVEFLKTLTGQPVPEHLRTSPLE